INNSGSSPQVDWNVPDDFSQRIDDLVLPRNLWRNLMRTGAGRSNQTLMLESRYVLLTFLQPLATLFGEVAIYDFDPKLPKLAVPMSGKSELEEDGRNLSVVLKNILDDPEQRRAFANLVSDLLPFVSGVKVQKFAGKSLLFSLRDSGHSGVYWPASLL